MEKCAMNTEQINPGLIVIDKPRGPTSHQVTAWVGEMLGMHVGHSGTLDPQVSGVLVIMLGHAVRLAPVLLRHEKEYVCLMRLHGDVPRDRVEETVRAFTGRIYQRPPKKSAVARNLQDKDHPGCRNPRYFRSSGTHASDMRRRNIHSLTLSSHRAHASGRCSYAGAQKDQVRTIQ